MTFRSANSRQQAEEWESEPCEQKCRDSAQDRGRDGDEYPRDFGEYSEDNQESRANVTRETVRATGD